MGLRNYIFMLVNVSCLLHKRLALRKKSRVPDGYNTSYIIIYNCYTSYNTLNRITVNPKFRRYTLYIDFGYAGLSLTHASWS